MQPPIPEAPKVVAIVGPTASGKTALSIYLAQKFDGEIISADSRQVYRSLDIGTDKITPREMQGVPHHLIDVVAPTDVFTVADFVAQGRATIAAIVADGHIPFVVGGTGFYIQALLDGITIPHVPPNLELRSELEHQSTEGLLALLEEKDPDRAQTIESKNRRRLIRALEIVAALGKVPHLTKEAPYPTLYIGLETDDATLRTRIRERMDTQLAHGLLEEVRRVMDTVTTDRLHEFGYEYSITAAHLRGEISYEEMQEQLEAKLWQYSRRQRTWFKRDTRIHWFARDDVQSVETLVREFLYA